MGQPAPSAEESAFYRKCVDHVERPGDALPKTKNGMWARKTALREGRLKTTAMLEAEALAPKAEAEAEAEAEAPEEDAVTPLDPDGQPAVAEIVDGEVVSVGSTDHDGSSPDIADELLG